MTDTHVQDFEIQDFLKDTLILDFEIQDFAEDTLSDTLFDTLLKNSKIKICDSETDPPLNLSLGRNEKHNPSMLTSSMIKHCTGYTSKVLSS